MAKQPVILVGGGGHCRSVIDVIESTGLYEIRGILEKDTGHTDVLGYPVIGTDDQVDQFIKDCPNFHITVGHIKSNKVRVKLYDTIKAMGGTFPAIIASTAYVSKHAEIGEGTIIMHNALVNAGAKIGSNCIINTGATLEHDTVISDHCHISTGAYLNGECAVGENVFIGSRSVVIQGIKVAAGSLIAAGSVVIRDTETGNLYAGNPATIKKKS